MLNKGRAAEAGHFHAVRFYEDAQSLSRMVATFVAEGFIESLPAIIIATPEHRDAIIDKLNAMSFDLDDLERRGDLIVLDAGDTLAQFMVDGMPNAEKFEAAMLPVIDTRRTPLHAVIEALEAVRLLIQPMLIQRRQNGLHSP